MIVEVQKEDILKIGDTVFEVNGFTTFVMSSNDSLWIKEILLRNILKIFSDDCQITNIEDYELDDNNYEVTKQIIMTNLPWEEYERLAHIC